MVLAFFRNDSSDGNFDSIVSKSVGMLGDARHSFDLATLALLTDADPATVAKDIRDTDMRINEVEHELRSELVVHVSVQGSADIGSVLGFTLLVKKIERIGDQAKSILELAEAGVNLSGSSDVQAKKLCHLRSTTATSSGPSPTCSALFAPQQSLSRTSMTYRVLAKTAGISTPVTTDRFTGRPVDRSPDARRRCQTS